MVELTDAEIAAAEEHGRLYRATHPHASSARYDRKSDRVVIELDSGATFAFPPRLVEGLSDATADELAEVELLGDGFGLHWEGLDVDYTVPGLVNGIFGTAKWIAARAGRATSPAKAAAARVNGAKGTAVEGGGVTSGYSTRGAAVDPNSLLFQSAWEPARQNTRWISLAIAERRPTSDR